MQGNFGNRFRLSWRLNHVHLIPVCDRRLHDLCTEGMCQENLKKQNVRLRKRLYICQDAERWSLFRIKEIRAIICEV